MGEWVGFWIKVKVWSGVESSYKNKYKIIASSVFKNTKDVKLIFND